MNDRGDNKKKRGIAEAHLYVAIIKADNNISGRELLEASNLVRHSQKCLNMLNVSPYNGSVISTHINSIVRDSTYYTWDWKAHLEKAMSILLQLKNDGDWNVKLIPDRIEDGLRKVSWVDGYDIHESKIVERILSELKLLRDD